MVSLAEIYGFRFEDKEMQSQAVFFGGPLICSHELRPMRVRSMAKRRRYTPCWRRYLAWLLKPALRARAPGCGGRQNQAGRLQAAADTRCAGGDIRQGRTGAERN